MISRKQLLSAAFLLTLTVALPAPSLAQGCTQCLDTTASTHSETQAGYRRAIVLLAGAAATVFTAGVWLLRRNP